MQRSMRALLRGTSQSDRPRLNPQARVRGEFEDLRTYLNRLSPQFTTISKAVLLEIVELLRAGEKNGLVYSDDIKGILKDFAGAKALTPADPEYDPTSPVIAVLPDKTHWPIQETGATTEPEASVPSMQVFTVPPGVTSVNISIARAGGGGASGPVAQSIGDMMVQAGQQIRVMMGGGTGAAGSAGNYVASGGNGGDVNSRNIRQRAAARQEPPEFGHHPCSRNYQPTFIGGYCHGNLVELHHLGRDLIDMIQESRSSRGVIRHTHQYIRRTCPRTARVYYTIATLTRQAAVEYIVEWEMERCTRQGTEIASSLMEDPRERARLTDEMAWALRTLGESYVAVRDSLYVGGPHAGLHVPRAMAGPTTIQVAVRRAHLRTIDDPISVATEIETVTYERFELVIRGEHVIHYKAPGMSQHVATVTLATYCNNVNRITHGG